MKAFILLVCALGILGFLGELIYRMIEEKGFKSLKLLFMLPVYVSFGAIMSLVYLIPCFGNFAFLPFFMFIGGGVATGLELAFGILYNKILKLDVWKYSENFINIFGLKIPSMRQINLKHSLLYVLLSPLVCYFNEIIKFLSN